MTAVNFDLIPNKPTQLAGDAQQDEDDEDDDEEAEEEEEDQENENDVQMDIRGDDFAGLEGTIRMEEEPDSWDADDGGGDGLFGEGGDDDDHEDDLELVDATNPVVGSSNPSQLGDKRKLNEDEDYDF